MCILEYCFLETRKKYKLTLTTFQRISTCCERYNKLTTEVRGIGYFNNRFNVSYVDFYLIESL